MLQTGIQHAPSTSASRLDQLVAEMSAHVEAGEPVDLVALTADCPELREQLEMLLPTLQAVVELEHSLAGDADDTAHVGEFLRNSQADGSAMGQLGDFRIVREIGRGGMGVVYEAEQLSIGRRVALKVLPFAAMLDRQQLNRFKNEARAAGTLDHPNIVAIYSVGCERSVHFYAMQLIEGQSLAQVIEQVGAASRAAREVPLNDIELESQGSARLAEPTKLDTAPIARLSTLPDFHTREYFQTVAQLGIQAADALDHAHRNGILHRDIKPANLLLECTHLAPRDDAATNAPRNAKSHPVEDRPWRSERDGHILKLWITDFGLARIEQDVSMTMTGDILGTLRYMSPEQALGKRAVIDHRSDIYSLGITLYELLAGCPAFNVTGRAELLRAIVEVDPLPIRKLAPRIPADLATIVHKAIAKDAADRYSTAGEFAADLRGLIENRPIAARRPSLASRASKWARRHWAIVRILCASVVLGIIGLSVSTFLLNRAYRQSAERQTQAEKNLQIAVDAIDNLLARVANSADFHGQLRHAEQLYTDAADAYDRVLENTKEPAFVLKAASSRARLAEVFKEAGRHDRALQEAERGLQLLQTLPSSDDIRESEMQSRAKLLGIRGSAYMHLGNFVAAEWSIGEALHLREQLVETATDKTEHFKNLSLAFNTKGVLCTETGRLDEGEQLFRRALAIREVLPEEARKDDFWLSDAAGLTCNLGTTDRDRGNLASAEKSFRKAIELQRQAMVSRPDYQAYRNDLYIYHWNLTDTFLRVGRHDEAANEVASMTSEFSERLQVHVEAVCFLMRCIAVAETTNAGFTTSAAASQGSSPAGSAVERYRDQAREIKLQMTTATFAPPDSQVALAWLLATCPDREFRDGKRALEIVHRLQASGLQSVHLQQALSAAHLETKDFDAAYQVAKLSLRSKAGGSAHYFLLLALSQAARGEWNDAQQWYTHALAAQTDNCCLQGLLADAKCVFDSQERSSAFTGNE